MIGVHDAAGALHRCPGRSGCWAARRLLSSSASLSVTKDRLLSGSPPRTPDHGGSAPDVVASPVEYMETRRGDGISDDRTRGGCRVLRYSCSGTASRDRGNVNGSP